MNYVEKTLLCLCIFVSIQSWGYFVENPSASNIALTITYSRGNSQIPPESTLIKNFISRPEFNFVLKNIEEESATTENVLDAVEKIWGYFCKGSLSIRSLFQVYWDGWRDC